MQHLDEGTIHAWLDGALDAAEGARVEQHVAACASCAAAVAEARGLVAGASRILSALDYVPGNVAPRAGGGSGPEHDIGSAMARRRARGGGGTLWRALRLTPARAAAAAVIIMAAGTVLVARQQGSNRAMDVVAAVALDTAAPGPSAPLPVITPPAVEGGVAGTPVDPALGGVRAARRSSALRRAAVAQRLDSSAEQGRAPEVAGNQAKAVQRPLPSGAGAVASALKADEVARDSTLVVQREVAERRAVRMPEPAPPANAAPAPARSELRQRAMADVQASDASRPIAVAGCYAVTSDGSVALPTRISLDTASSLGVAAGFAAPVTPPTAQSAVPPAARRLENVAVMSGAREAAILRRITIPDTIADTRRPVVGSWMQPNSSTVRVTLSGGLSPATVLVLQNDGAGALRGVVQGRDVAVTLRRVECVTR